MTVVADIALVALVVVAAARLFMHVGGELERMNAVCVNLAKAVERIDTSANLSSETAASATARAQVLERIVDGAREDIQQLFDATHTKRRRRI